MGWKKRRGFCPWLAAHATTIPRAVLAGCGGRLPAYPPAMNTEQSPGSALTNLWLQIRAVLDLVLDLSFKRFVTPRLVRMLYVLSLLAAVFYAGSYMFSGFKEGPLTGLFQLVTAPLAFLLYLIFARVVVEIILAIFRIADRIAPLSEEEAAKVVKNPADPSPH